MNMNTKSIISLTLALFLATSALFGAVSFVKAAGPAVYIDPATVTPSAIGGTFTVTVKAADVSALNAWYAKLSWNPAVLECTTILQGNFLNSVAATFWASSKDNAVGWAEGNCAFLSADVVSGSGNLMTVTFKVIGFGNTNINFAQSRLVGPPPARSEYTHTATGAVVNGIPLPNPYGPTAAFSYNDTDGWYLNATGVSLDASASLDAFDNQGAIEICPITSWIWNIDVGNNGSVDFSLSGETAAFTALYSGVDQTKQIKITLTVTAPDPTAPSGPGFSSTDVETQIITVYAPPSGASVDVFTQYGGEGPNTSSDMYGPQEDVVIYAEVTYNNAPVANKDVAFEIKNAQNITIGYRTARTNSSGIATVTYRLPWSDGTTPEAGFGTWNIIATVDVSEVIVDDVVFFQFDYVIEIESVVATPSTVGRGDNVNIAYTLSCKRAAGAYVKVSITIYDECLVPVAVQLPGMTFTGIAAGQTADLDLSIVSYAFVGQGRVYVNALTAAPGINGVPYCPEYSIPVVITE